MTWDLVRHNVHANESKAGLVTENCNNIGTSSNSRNLPEDSGNYVNYIVQSNKNSKARRNFTAVNMTTGTVCLHLGHNSEYRFFPTAFFVNFYSANGSLQFAVDTGRNPKTKCIAISPSAASGSQTGTFNAAAVTGIELQMQTAADAPTSSIVFLQWWSYIPAIANHSEITKIYGTTTLNNLCREITNDGFGAWSASSITGNGQQSNAYLPGPVAEIMRAPLQFGKSGEDAVITINRNVDLATTSLNDHQSESGAALINGWDTAQSNSLTVSDGVIINHVTPQIVTIFDVDAGVTFNVTNIVFKNALGFKIGAAFAGVVKASMSSLTQELETRANVNGWQVTGGILAADSNQSTFNNVKCDTLKLINLSHTASLINITNSTITNVTNATNLAIVLSIAETSTVAAHTGFFAAIDSGVIDSGALPIVYNASASGITLSGGIVTVGDNTNTLKTTGGITVVGTVLDVSTIGAVSVSTSVQSSVNFTHTSVTFTSGEAEVNFANWKTASVSNATGADLTYSGLLPLNNSGVWRQYTPSTLNFTANNARWAIYNNSGAFIESGTGNKTLNHSAGVDAGTWNIIAHKAGQQAQLISWVANDGSINNQAYTAAVIQKTDGSAAYSAGLTAQTLTALFNNQVRTLIGNTKIEPQQLIDSQQNFLNTDAGLAWLFSKSAPQAPFFGLVNGAASYFNTEDFIGDRQANSPNAALAAGIEKLSSHEFIVQDNGGFAAGGGNATAAEIAVLLWDSSNQSAFDTLSSSLATRVDVQAVEQQMTVD